MFHHTPLFRRCALAILACCVVMLARIPEVRAAETPVIATQALMDLVASHKGKVVVLNFFASWCPPCREEIPGLLRLNREYGDKVVFIGLSVDEDPKALERFVAATGFTYPIYSATDDVARLYSVSAIPHNVVYDRAGKLVANQGGYVEEKALKAFIAPLLAKP